MPRTQASVKTGSMTYQVRNMARLMSTMLGGALCRPMPWRRIDRTVTMKGKQVTITARPGTTERTVMRSRSWTERAARLSPSPRSSVMPWAAAGSDRRRTAVPRRRSAARAVASARSVARPAIRLAWVGAGLRGGAARQRSCQEGDGSGRVAGGGTRAGRPGVAPSAEGSAGARPSVTGATGRTGGRARSQSARIACRDAWTRGVGAVSGGSPGLVCPCGAGSAFALCGDRRGRRTLTTRP